MKTGLFIVRVCSAMLILVSSKLYIELYWDHLFFGLLSFVILCYTILWYSYICTYTVTYIKYIYNYIMSNGFSEHPTVQT